MPHELIILHKQMIKLRYLILETVLLNVEQVVGFIMLYIWLVFTTLYESLYNIKSTLWAVILVNHCIFRHLQYVTTESKTGHLVNVTFPILRLVHAKIQNN